jgi:hypothetical protein
MDKRGTLRERFRRLGAQRWKREILLAILLTIAAMIFTATAILGLDDGARDEPYFQAARKPLPR